MNKYWITFRLHSDATYEKRYNAMLQAMIDVRGAQWAEPTSFWLAESELDIDELILKLTKPLNANTDLLVMRYLAIDESRSFGKVEHLDILKHFLPNIKKSS